jgi:hypothetical protein
MFGKRHVLRLLGAISIAASVAVFAVPSASAAHAAPSFYDNGVTIGDGYAAEVAQAVQESGFAGPASSSGDGMSFGLGDAALGVLIGAGLMLLLLGPQRARSHTTQPAAVFATK